MKIYHGSIDIELIDQYLFHTEKSLEFINFMIAEEITL